MAASRKTKVPKKLQRHCAEVHADPEETIHEQRNRFTKFKKKDGDRHFTEQGRVAEITTLLVLKTNGKYVKQTKSTGDKIPL